MKTCSCSSGFSVSEIPSLRNSLLGIEEVKVSYEEDVSYKRTPPDFQDLDVEYLNAVLHGHRFVGSDHEHL